MNRLPGAEAPNNSERKGKFRTLKTAENLNCYQFNLGKWIQVIKKANKKRSHQCKYCGKAFLTRIKLKSHVRDSHEQSFECQVCGKLFGQSAYLKIHLRTVDEKMKDFSFEQH